MIVHTRLSLEEVVKAPLSFALIKILGVMLLVISLHSNSVLANEKVRFSIPKTSADVALKLYAQQAKRQVLYPFDLVTKYQANGLKGLYRPDTALTKLFEGTGLYAFVDNNNNLVVRLATSEEQKMSIRKKRWGLAAAFSTLFTANSIIAQEGSLLEEVVVTARKVEENLQETPVAVSAFTEQAIERRMLMTTEDLGRVTPNLQFKSHAPLSGNGSAAQVFIRGVGQSDASGGVDPGVGIYIDDVYMGRSVGGVMGFRDIANVQVLRGPQGTLFGRNTIGGAVLLSTRTPGDEFAGSVKISMGDDSLREIFGAVDLPFSDQVAARISYGARERDGYVERRFDGIDLGNEDTYTLNGSLHVDVNDSLNIVLRGDYTEEDENGSPFVFAAINENAAFPAYQSVNAGCPGATFPPPSVPTGVNDVRCANNETWNLGPFTNGGTTKAESTVENKGFSLTTNWEVNDSISLKYIVADRTLKWSGSRDADNTALPILSTQYESEAEQTSHELQMIIEGERYSGVTGIFFFDEKVDDFLLVPFGPPGPPAGIVPVDYQRAILDNESVAFFTNWTFDITDTLSISAGARRTEEDKTMEVIAASAGVTPVPIPEPLVFAEPTTNLNVPRGPHDNSFNEDTFSLSFQWAVSDTINTYFSWSEGFKSGGFNQRYNVPAGGTPFTDVVQFLPEFVTSYEIGVKADLSDSLRLNAAIFNSDYEDMQLTYRVGIVPLLFNAGKASIDGLEIELSYSPNANFIIEGSLGYLDDKVESVSVIPGASTTFGPGSDLPFTPDISANVSSSYRFNLGDNWGLTPRLEVAYTSEQYFDTANTNEVAQSNAETITNFSLRLDDNDDTWNVVLGVENLTDELYPVAGNSSLSTGSGYAEIVYTRPRNYYLSASYNF
jgi:iron complex outermembrane receptor protein